MPLKLIKITVDAGLYNLRVKSPACMCQDLDTCMRGTPIISVDSLMVAPGDNGKTSTLKIDVTFTAA